MRVPWVPAGLGSDCGPSCLAMVLSHLGRDTSVEEIRGLLGTGRDGTSAYDLITAARALGLRAEGLRAESWAAAATLRLPAIVHYHRGHFVVLEQISRNGNARIVDPLEGRQRLPRTELERLASGVILTFEPGPDFERRRQRIGWRFIRSTLSGEPAALGRLIAVSLALQATAFAMPAAVAYVVDHLVGDEAPGFLTLVLAGVPVLILAQLATGMLRGRFMAGLVARTSRRWLDELFQHLLRLPLRFFQGRSVEDLLVRIQGSEQVIESLLDEVSTAVLDTLLALTALIAVWAMYPRLSGLVLAVGLVQAVITWFARRQTLDEWMQDILVHSRLYSFASEALGGIAELKIAGLEQIAPTWGTHLDERIRAGARRRRRTAAWDALQQSTQTAGPLLVLAAGAGLAGRGEISIGAVVGFYSLAGVCLAPLGRLATGIYRFQTTLQYLRRAREILDLPVETEGGQAAPPRLGGRLTLAGVCFSHAPLAPPVLTGIDLEIPPGSTTVVLGRSGVGKSTLARILATLLEPTAGRLRVDGIQLEQLRRDQLRARIGIVFQESFLLADSIARNIAFGREVADEQIRRAADLACLLEDLRLMPMGFATPVGSLGHHLSGGQRQRLCLARALAGDPDILILDEGTSAVDLATERQIIANLATLGCTRILFTHRLHVAPLADQVVVLEAGQIVDRGHHAELLDRCRLYAEMWADVEPEQPQEPVLQHQQPA